MGRTTKGQATEKAGGGEEWTKPFAFFTRVFIARRQLSYLYFVGAQSKREAFEESKTGRDSLQLCVAMLVQDTISCYHSKSANDDCQDNFCAHR